jgi:hypothetical protein
VPPPGITLPGRSVPPSPHSLPPTCPSSSSVSGSGSGSSSGSGSRPQTCSAQKTRVRSCQPVKAAHPPSPRYMGDAAIDSWPSAPLAILSYRCLTRLPAFHARLRAGTGNPPLLDRSITMAFEHLTSQECPLFPVTHEFSARRVLLVTPYPGRDRDHDGKRDSSSNTSARIRDRWGHPDLAARRILPGVTPVACLIQVMSGFGASGTSERASTVPP